MKSGVYALAVLAAGTLTAAEGARPFRYNGYGMVFFSAGACHHGYLNVGAGAGGEGFLWRGLTLGGEAGYYRFPADRNAGYGIFTIGPGYHFVNRGKASGIDPYLNVGLAGAALAPGGFSSAGSIGGGVNYWFKERIGLQTGAQIHVLGGEEAVVAFRVGLTFR